LYLPIYILTNYIAKVITVFLLHYNIHVYNLPIIRDKLLYTLYASIKLVAP